MAHELAGAFQNSLRVGKLSASKESDIHVVLEDIDVPKRRIRHAGRWVPIVQAFSHVVSALTHGRKPMRRNFTQFARVLSQPGINSGSSPGRIGKLKELAHICIWIGSMFYGVPFLTKIT
jgi:hypothetical protein